MRSGHLPGSPDLQRMQNQQRFLAALVRRVTDIGLLQNPVKLDQVAKAALGSVRADRQTKPDDLIALATGLRGGFGARSVEFATVPVDATPFRVQGVGTTLRWDVKGAQRIFEALREDRPLTGPDGGPLATPSPSAPEPEQVEVPPKSIRVQVNNGTTVNGLGARVDKELRRLGFRTTGAPGNTVRHDAEYTVIHYDPGWDRSAKALGTALPYAELRRVSGLGPTLRITVGADYDGVTPVRVRRAGPARGTAGGAPADARRPHLLRLRAGGRQSSKPSAARFSRSSMIARRRASRCVRRICASCRRRRSRSVSGSIWGTGRGAPSASTATKTR